MFNLALFHLLGSSPKISPTTVKLFCRLVADVDLRKPRALSSRLIQRRYRLALEERQFTEASVEELLTAGVIERVGNAGQRQLYRVPPKWWLGKDEIRQELKEQEAQLGREDLTFPRPGEDIADQSGGGDVQLHDSSCRVG